jgi:hypothetical protein
MFNDLHDWQRDRDGGSIPAAPDRQVAAMRFGN